MLTLCTCGPLVLESITESFPLLLKSTLPVTKSVSSSAKPYAALVPGQMRPECVASPAVTLPATVPVPRNVAALEDALPMDTVLVTEPVTDIIPAPIVVAPEYVFDPDSVWVPVPIFVSERICVASCKLPLKSPEPFD